MKNINKETIKTIYISLTIGVVLGAVGMNMLRGYIATSVQAASKAPVSVSVSPSPKH